MLLRNSVGFTQPVCSDASSFRSRTVASLHPGSDPPNAFAFCTSSAPKPPLAPRIPGTHGLLCHVQQVAFAEPFSRTHTCDVEAHMAEYKLPAMLPHILWGCRGNIFYKQKPCSWLVGWVQLVSSRFTHKGLSKKSLQVVDTHSVTRHLCHFSRRICGSMVFLYH